MLFSRNGYFEPLKMRIEKVSGRRAGLGEVGRCPRREQRAMKDDQRSVGARFTTVAYGSTN